MLGSGDISPGHGGLHHRIFDNSTESQPTDITQQLSKRALRNDHGRQFALNIANDFRLIRQFVAALSQFDENTTNDEIRDVDRKLRSNLFRSIDQLDAAMAFSAEFFSANTLKEVCDWSDTERVIRLRHMDEVTPRNLERTIRRKIGSGYQRPTSSLRRVIESENFMLNLIEEEDVESSTQTNSLAKQAH